MLLGSQSVEKNVVSVKISFHIFKLLTLSSRILDSESTTGMVSKRCLSFMVLGINGSGECAQGNIYTLLDLGLFKNGSRLKSLIK